jgi:hypothetical protein
MKRLLLASLALLGLLGPLAAGPARAQMPYYQPMVNPYYRPPVSPYLNLALPGNTAINYYGLVRPQVQAMNAINQLQGQVLQNEQALYAAEAYGPQQFPVTGHTAGFQNHLGYFQNWRTRSGPGSPALAGGSGAPGYAGAGPVTGAAPGFGVVPGAGTGIVPPARNFQGPRPGGR